MKNVEVLLQELEAHIPHWEYCDPAISKGSVGWHIEHSLLTMNVIIHALKNSDPGQYKWTFDWRRSYVIMTGKIPRGRIKAPTVVQPAAAFTVESLQKHLAHTKENLKDLHQLQANHFFKHPFLGDIKLKPAIRFLQTHTNHHVAIINDIVNKSKK